MKKKENHHKLFSNAKEKALKFRKEFKKQTLAAITAAFALLIALSWQEPISNLVRAIIERFELSRNIVYYQFLSAIIVTVIGVFVLLLISRWASDG